MSPVFSYLLSRPHPGIQVLYFQLSSQHLTLTSPPSSPPQIAPPTSSPLSKWQPLLPATWIPLSPTPPFGQVPNAASSVFGLYPGSHHSSPYRPVPAPRSLAASYPDARPYWLRWPWPCPVACFHTAARGILLEQKSVRDSAAANCSGLPVHSG